MRIIKSSLKERNTHGENTMDHYTDEQCAQLIDCQDQHANDLGRISPVDGMSRILDLMALVGDNPLIAHWLAHQYGVKCCEHLTWYDGPSDMPTDYVDDFMHFVPSADPEYLDSIKLEMREGYNAISEAMLMRALIAKHT